VVEVLGLRGGMGRGVVVGGWVVKRSGERVVGVGGLDSEDGAVWILYSGLIPDVSFLDVDNLSIL
jgi:hypothetical protein